MSDRAKATPASATVPTSSAPSPTAPTSTLGYGIPGGNLSFHSAYGTSRPGAANRIQPASQYPGSSRVNAMLLSASGATSASAPPSSVPSMLLVTTAASVPSAANTSSGN